MQIPISYNIRNLTARKTTTLMTALGIALTVAVLLSVMAIGAGAALRKAAGALAIVFVFLVVLPDSPSAPPSPGCARCRPGTRTTTNRC